MFVAYLPYIFGPLSLIQLPASPAIFSCKTQEYDLKLCEFLGLSDTK